MSLEKKKALKLSDYVNSLDSVIKARYLKKISCIGVDPFLLCKQIHCFSPAERERKEALPTPDYYIQIFGCKHYGLFIAKPV